MRDEQGAAVGSNSRRTNCSGSIPDGARRRVPRVGRVQVRLMGIGRRGRSLLWEFRIENKRIPCFSQVCTLGLCREHRCSFWTFAVCCHPDVDRRVPERSAMLSRESKSERRRGPVASVSTLFAAQLLLFPHAVKDVLDRDAMMIPPTTKRPWMSAWRTSWGGRCAATPVTQRRRV